MATITINGVTFDKYHPKADAPIIWPNQGNKLSDIYKKPSEAKQKAFYFWARTCEALDGFNFAIVGHSCMFFSIMFDFVNPETGELMRAHATGMHAHLYHL